MTDASDDRDLLASARRGLSPTAADRARVRRATLAAVMLPAAAAAAGSTGVAAEAIRAGARTTSWATRLVAVGVVAAAAAGVGYRVGVRAGRELAASERPAAITTTVSPSLPQPAPAPESPVPPASSATQAPAPSPSITPPGDAQLSRATARRRATAGAAAPPESTVASPASLADEVRALRAVERALREGTPGFALSLLRELDRKLPNGRLLEERLATYSIARCASGDVPLGVNMADDFADRYPGSVYGRRVADACAGTDSSRAGHSVPRRSSHDEK